MADDRYDVILSRPGSPGECSRFFLGNHGYRSVIVAPSGDAHSASLQIARDQGALVLPRHGKLSGVRGAIAHLQSLPKPPALVVLATSSGLASSTSCEKLTATLLRERSELAIGVPSSLSPKERAVLRSIQLLYRVRYSALAHHVAIRFAGLVALGLSNNQLGLEAEILVKSAKLGLLTTEVPIGGKRADNPSLRRSALAVIRNIGAR